MNGFTVIMHEASANSALNDAMKTAFEGVQSDVMTGLGNILPVALAIVGAGLVITLGVKYFKKIANK